MVSHSMECPFQPEYLFKTSVLLFWMTSELCDDSAVRAKSGAKVFSIFFNSIITISIIFINYIDYLL